MRTPNVDAIAATRRHSGRTAGPGRVEIAEVHGTGNEEVATATGGELALAGAHRLTAHQADVAHRPPVVRPHARLLEPEQFVIGDQTGELHGFVDLPSLVGVGHQDEVVARRLARLDEPCGVFGRRQPTDLELHPGEATAAQLVDLIGNAHSGAVVAADRRHLDRVAVTAPQSPQRLPGGLADGVPDRRVDARAGDKPEPTVAQDVVGRRASQLPATFHGAGIDPDELRSDLVADDRRDLLQSGVLVSGVRLTDHTCGRVHLGDDRRAVGHSILAAAVGAVEGDADGDELDALDRQCRRRRVCARVDH